MGQMSEKGAEFERVVRRAMSAAGITTMTDLARETHIPRDTWYYWFRGDRIPRRSTLGTAATILRTPIDELMAPWGEAPATYTVNEDQLRALIRTSVAEGVELALRQITPETQTPPTSPEVQREVAEAEADLAARRDSEMRPRPAPHSGTEG
jgi:hypothetical protein